MEDTQRRQVVKALISALAISTLPSCSCLTGRESNSQNYEFNPDSYKVVDMHAHFFNATDVLVVEYLLGPATNDFVGNRFQFTRKLLMLVANFIVDMLKQKKITAQNELNWLRSKETKSLNLEALTTNSYRSDYEIVSEEFFAYITQESSALEASNKSLRQTEFSNLLAAVADEWEPTERKELFTLQKSTIEFDERTLLKSVLPSSIIKIKESELSAIEISKRCPTTPSVIRRILGFAGRALVKRSTNVQAYYDLFTLNADKMQPAVENVLNVGCDFDYFLGHENADSPIEDQIAVNEEIYRHTNGYAIPVLGVNPFKLGQDDEYLSVIDSALSRGIYKGVKLYPSIGYSATGVMRKNLDAWKGHLPTYANTSVVMQKLYDILESRDAFITSHTTQSKGFTSESISLAGSKYWDEILNQRPSLKVNFGHMGDKGNNRDKTWREGFLKLMAKHENVYADFGYHFGYSKYDELAKDLKWFRKNYGDSIFKKITYGSDWYMISKDSNSNSYFCDITRTFDQALKNRLLSRTEFDDIFFKNAKKILGNLASSEG
jgi:hypothetical protein